MKTESAEGNPEQARKGRAFIEHVEKVSREVRTWPQWKQDILGGPTRIPEPSSSPPASR